MAVSRKLASIALMASLGATLVACGGGGSGGPGSYGLPVEGVSIGAKSAQEITWAPSGVQPGNYIEVDASLSNQGSKSLPLAAMLFGISTSAGISYAGSPWTSSYPGGCDPRTSLAPGSTTDCIVLFPASPPDPATVNRLIYTLPDGREATASIAVQPGVPSFSIQPGGIAPFTAGQNGGYYLMYHGCGGWEIEWTCDPSLSPTCRFTGSVSSLQGSTITNGVGYDCDASVSPPSCTAQPIANGVSSTEFDFDDTAPGPNEFMSITFNVYPAAAIQVDVQVNGARSPALVFYPCAGGMLCSPTAIPFDLTP